MPFDLRGLRDRAILLIGYAGGLRRSEIVSLDVHKDDTPDSGGWIEIFDKGALLTLNAKTGWREVEIGRGSKDQTCPVHALEQWLHFAKIDFGPIFIGTSRDGKRASETRLNDKHVARLIKRTVLDAGIRSDLPEKERLALFSGHSLARRSRQLRRGRRALRPETPRPRLRRNDPTLPTPPRQVPGEPDQGRRIVTVFVHCPMAACT